MASPALLLLREYTSQDKPITLLNKDGQVVDKISACHNIKFDDDHIYSRETDTHIKKSTANNDKPTYRLDTLYFLLQHVREDNSTYFKECREQQVDHVSVVDKRKVIDYLTGKVNEIPFITSTGITTGDDGSQSTPTTHNKDTSNLNDGVNNTSTGKRQLEDQTSAQKKLKSSSNKEFLKRIKAQERELINQTTILQGTKSFDKLGDQVKSILYSKENDKNANKTKTQQNNKKLSAEDKIPIIIVPAAPTSKLNLFNIKDFLQNEKFVDAQELRASGEKKPEQVTIERKKLSGRSVVYHVVDSVTNFKQSDWDRVCCVLVTGQQWQFKGWKWEKPVEVFTHVKGFFPKWSSDKLSGGAAEWAVNVLNIHRDRRYMDKAAVVDFWQRLDSFNSQQKQFLNY
ncbi:unnamed protein product [Cunninghamella blakesleeana]